MSNANDFIIENGVLIKYVGPGGDVVIPDEVVEIGEGAFAAHNNIIIHASKNIQSVQWNLVDPVATLGLRSTICAPTGSVIERQVQLNRTKFGYRFIPEGEAVEPDDSHVRCERPFNDWRKYFNFSNRAKGSHVSAYLRSSKIVYLPDKFGKPDVASIEKDAFPEDTAVLCSKRLFAKLADENKLATIRALLSDTTLFTAEEIKYLKEYIKKNAANVFEVFIEEENTLAMATALEQTKYADVVMDAAMDAADRLGRADMRAFLLECKNKAGTVAK